MKLTKCPSPESLIQFCSGRAPESEIEKLGDHLGECQKCLAQVDRLNQHDHETVAFHPESRYLQEPQLTRLKSNAKTIVASNQPFDVVEAPDRVGPYEILRRLGAGGFAVVYAARDSRNDSTVALKLLHRKPGDGYDSEALTLQSLRHPSIVRVLDWGTLDDEYCYLAMQYIDGSSLYESLLKQTYDPLVAARLIAQVARALHHAHTCGFVHRDVKPGNILLDSEGNPKVSDFGLALHDDDQWSHRDEAAGTRPYMSPEQIRRESHRLDGRSDIWSLGVVLYEMLAGKRPFRGEGTEQLQDEILHRDPKPLRQYCDAVPFRLEQICLRCLSKAMSDRYSTALDLAGELEAWGESQAESSKDASTTPENGLVPLRIIPKGLRSFDTADSEFFLRLLPDPRDSSGIPESIRFWISRIQCRQADDSFNVGIIYGRSGSGKSSFVKAGILPRLGPNLERLYIEATATGTQDRIKAACVETFDFVLASDSLLDAMRMIRQQGQYGKKVLLVLDQFEQYLHGRPDRHDLRLVDALRQCDGKNLQCLLIVRDDFWMDISEFMRQLEIPLVEGVNSYPVQLFSIQHSSKVLTEFGRAYATIPEGPLSAEQETFITDAVRGLSRDGQVICLRLALFAHMMRSRRWVPATLREVGGLEGLGVKFLEESFQSPDALPVLRDQIEAACGVLGCLLPGPNDTIKGETRSRADLLRACGYQRQPERFDHLIELLDHELRLITPVAMDKANDRTDSKHGRNGIDGAGEPRQEYYQLSHDYLVPSLRNWLQLREQSTYRGRAALRLRSREQHWRRFRERRQLPTLWETASIGLLTKQAQWTSNQRLMMRKAATHHSLRLLALAAPLLVLLFSLGMWQTTTSRVTRLLECAPDAIPSAIDDIQSLRWFALPSLRARVKDESLTPERRLRSAMALAHLGEPRSSVVIRESVRVPSDYASGILASLRADSTSRQQLLDFVAAMEPSSGSEAQVAVVALIALNLGERAPAEEMTRGREDPSLRTHFIDQFPHWISDAESLTHALSASENSDFQSALCIGIGRLAGISDSFGEAERSALEATLERLYSESKSPAVHSAAAYAMRRWKFELPSLPSPWPTSNATDGSFGWSVTKSGLHLLEVASGGILWIVDNQPAVVEVPRFLLADREVSRDLYEAFLIDEGFHSGSESDTRVSPTGEHPANSVSWVGAIEFLNWLSRGEGLPPYYRLINGVWQVPDPNGTGYRLPTEREWEFVCRAGTRTHYYFGDEPRFLEHYATFGSSLSCTPCGEKIPNAWGFFDMLGNVWEWCQQDAREPSRHGTRGDQAENPVAAIRGGAYDNPAQILRSNNRVELNIHQRLNGIGFRIARNPEPGGIE